VFFGMLASAIVGTLMVPACFAGVQQLRERLKRLAALRRDRVTAQAPPASGT
jgi:hypothetical protein